MRDWSSCSRKGFIQILRLSFNTIVTLPQFVLNQFSYFILIYGILLQNRGRWFKTKQNCLTFVIVNHFLLEYIKSIRLFSRVCMYNISAERFFLLFLTTLLQLCFHIWNCYHVLLFIKAVYLQEWLKSWLHLRLCVQSWKGLKEGKYSIIRNLSTNREVLKCSCFHVKRFSGETGERQFPIMGDCLMIPTQLG